MTHPSQPDDQPRFRAGRLKAGGRLEADTIIIGAQIEGADAETTRALLDLATRFDSGDVEVAQDIIAKHVVTGLHYLGHGDTEFSRQQFQQELTALRQQLAHAIAAGEIADEEDAEDAQKAVDRAIKHTQVEAPIAEKITTHLDRASTVLTQAASVAESAGKVQAAVIKLAPLVKVLKGLVGLLF